MAGMVAGFLSGVGIARQQQQQDEAARIAAEERMYQRGRRGTLDQREDMSFDQGQGDRAMRLQAYQEDRGYLTGTERPRADRRAAREERVSEFREGRMGTEAQQADQKFLWQMKREDRDAHMDGLRAQLAQYGLDEQRVAAEARQAQEAFKPAVAAFARTNDPRVFAEWANQTVAKNDPIEIFQNEAGDWVFQSQSGQPQVLGKAENVMRAARMLTNPDVFLESQAAQAKARADAAMAEQENPGRFYELVNDDSGALLQVDQRTGQARPVMRDGGQAPLVGTKAGAFGSRAGELTLGVRRPGQAQAGPMEPRFVEGNAQLGAQQRASQMAPARPAVAPQRSAAPPEGARVRGPDGRIYVVRNGRPVPEQ